MTISEILDHCDASVAKHGYIVFTDEHFRALTPEGVAAVRERYGARILMQLPANEIAFFTWLKDADPPVWTDLWGGTDQPYLVSLAFLADFSGGQAGIGQFVICDLVGTDNYYFSPNLLLEKESTDYVEAVRERFLQRSSMTPAQLLTVEASVGPVDIWHFAYRFSIDLDVAKRAVQTLVDDRVLLHVTSAEHLAQYFDAGSSS